MKVSKWLQVAFCIAAASSVVGCGNKAGVSSTDSNVVIVDQIPREERLTVFDAKLAEVKDEKSATEALTTFSTYVASQTGIIGQGTSPTSLSPGVIPNALISKIAKLEMKVRSQMQNTSPTSTDEESGISSEKIAETLNSMEATGDTQIRASDIDVVKEGVRAELPHVSPNGSENMTPTEAMVVAYSFTTGDDGSGIPSESKNVVSEDKVNQFVDKVSE